MEGGAGIETEKSREQNTKEKINSPRACLGDLFPDSDLEPGQKSLTNTSLLQSGIIDLSSLPPTPKNMNQKTKQIK